ELKMDVVLPQFVADALEGAALRGAGIVDQDVDLAETRRRLRDRPAAAISGTDVGRHRHHLGVALPGDIGARQIENLLAPRHQRDIGAGPDEGFGDGTADAYAAPRAPGVAPLRGELP